MCIVEAVRSETWGGEGGQQTTFMYVARHKQMQVADHVEPAAAWPGPWMAGNSHVTCCHTGPSYEG